MTDHPNDPQRCGYHEMKEDGRRCTMVDGHDGQHRFEVPKFVRHKWALNHQICQRCGLTANTILDRYHESGGRAVSCEGEG